MDQRKKILAIIGSASDKSSNRKIVENFISLTKDYFDVTIFESLKALPHFDPQLSIYNTPEEILSFRQRIENADGVLICTPEYIFSVPSGLKNALEWCVSTTIFTDKPLAIITASAEGSKGHEELQLIMRTLMARFTDHTLLLIHGVKSKLSSEGEINDNELIEKLKHLGTALNVQIS